LVQCTYNKYNQNIKTMNTVGEVIDVKEISKKSREMYFPDLMKLLHQKINIFWSWGCHNYIVDNKKKVKMFRMNVQGYHHKGHVYIFLNGMDLFDVYLTSTHDTIKTIGTDLYFDMLVDWIDEHVERIPAYNN
jgi:hypothetical protein